MNAAPEACPFSASICIDLINSNISLRQLVVHETRDCVHGAKAWQRGRVNARRKQLFRGVVKQSHQPLSTRLRQQPVLGKLRLREITARQVINRSFRNLDLKVFLDAKQQIEQVHRSEREVVEEELLRRDRLILRKRERLAHKHRNFRGCVTLAHAVTPPSTHQTWPVTYELIGDAKKRTTGRTSSASPGLCIGIAARAWSMWSSRMRALIPPASSPGATALILIPRVAVSRAVVRTKVSTAAFEEA